VYWATTHSSKTKILLRGQEDLRRRLIDPRTRNGMCCEKRRDEGSFLESSLCEAAEGLIKDTVCPPAAAATAPGLQKSLLAPVAGSQVA